MMAVHREPVDLQWSIDSHTDVLIHPHELRFSNITIEQDKVDHREEECLDRIHLLND
jgi:hypothetical protein